jgi:ATP-dependent helicase IRC3
VAKGIPVGSPLKLHPFQEDALRISKEKWKKGITRQLLSLPTGTGKTCIFACLPRHHEIDKRMLVLAHREELILQAQAQFRRWNRDRTLKVGIEMAGHESSRSDDVVICSVQSIGRANSGRLWRLPPYDFDVIVCDEAHHSAASTYLRVFNHFGLLESDNEKLLFGVTATPFRADDKALVPGVYQEVFRVMDILDGIEEGWLCDLRSYRVEGTGSNLDQVRTCADDFAENQLENVVDNRIRNGLIAKEWRRLAGKRRTLVFAVTVRHAQNLAAAFRDYGANAEAVWGDDPQRQQKLLRHKQGTVQVLCNCAVLTEGYDDRGIDCIVMARPTLSRVLFVQMIGRGTRVEEGLTNLVEARRDGRPIRKPECVVIDVVDNTKEHDLITLPRLFSSTLDFQGRSLNDIRRQAHPGQICNPYLNAAEIQQVERTQMRVQEIDLFRGARPSAEKVKTLTCEFCNRVIYQPNLKAHLREHGLGPSYRTQPGPYRNCPYCNQRMHRRRLRKHIMKATCQRRPR